MFHFGSVMKGITFYGSIVTDVSWHGVNNTVSSTGYDKLFKDLN